MHDWKKIASKIGPLRYQMSDSDCVPTTIVNAMLFLLQRRLHPRLLSMLWHISVETKSGSGWVTCQLLSDTLNSWFLRAHLDGNEKGVLPFKSKIIEGDAAHLERNNSLARSINIGGVCCLTVNDGKHYVLLHATNGRQFLAFDPYWCRKLSSTASQQRYKEYFGLVNASYTRDELASELENGNNKWIHIIAPITQLRE